MGDRRPQGNTFTAIATIKDATFWHAMARWKNLLEPIAIMTNMHQATHARPEHVVLSFGFLYFKYSQLTDTADSTACKAVLESAEQRWGQCDQEVFIAAVVVNPFYKTSPFKKIALTTRAGIAALFGHLWLCFYGGEAPVELFTDLDHYLGCFGDFAFMEVFKNSLLAHAQQMHTPVDALEVWNGIAKQLLSLCPNSASCEWLFNMFGEILTKWQNRLSTENLTALAELKMYVQEEHAHDQVVKKWLKHQGLDDDLKLYQLLDLDAEGEDDPDHVFIG
ncbi:hypothetical protein BKA82DRAFT_4357460 [Pisolithus tinctorius]|nr:hypothetical protein BKA82DRAFT_4357460 [Pisolithus tinctorius]